MMESTRTSRHLAVALAAVALGAAPAQAQVAPPPAPSFIPGPGATPDYFGVFPNYANSPLPVATSNVGYVGNPLVARQYATDFASPPTVFVVVNAPLPAGTLQSFQSLNQATPGSSPTASGPNSFHAYVLRPAGGSQYTVVLDSGALTVPAVTADAVQTYPVTPFAVQAGDLAAFYGQGIPVDTGLGTDTLLYPAPTAPTVSQIITLGDASFPVYPQQRTYSFGANVQSGTVSGGLRKFVDGLPRLNAAGANNLGQYIPVAIPDTTTYAGSDYYEIEVGEYSERMHSDLPATRLRGYRQTNTTDATVARFHYLGPLIVAQRDRPVRIKFTNSLPTTSAGGNLFLPVDTTYMGAGEGPVDATGNPCEPGNAGACVRFTQNRATIHLHGATTPWISDGTTHQWITPAGESTPYPKGVSVRNVPDMPDPGPGAMTFFYTNQQSARLMFYHDHAFGITRLNVYAGEAAGYLLQDPVEQGLVQSGVLPADQIPLVIQDKTFVPDDTVPFVNQVGSFPSQLRAQDPTWDSRWGGFGQLWFPHVYMPNQNPYDLTGANAMGRWDYGPWFWPPFTGLTYGPIANPYAANPGEPPFIPGTPDARGLSPSGVPEAFMDTPVVNGTAYPTLTVDAKAYRFRILNAADDRFWNLSLWVADPSVTTADGRTQTEVKMVPFNSSQNAAKPFPAWWYTAGNPFSLDDRAGGVPDPDTRGPAMIQIGTEGGFLPAPVVIRNQPVNYDYNRRDIVVLNVQEKALFLGPAERADVVVDFSNFAGKTLIVYNDAPAPVPASDPRLDYYTNDPDQADTGGAPSTLPGYGPNTRTIMQIVVRGSGGTAPVDDVGPTLLGALQTALPAAFAGSQEPIIVPQAAYNGVYTSTPVTDQVGASFARIQDTSMTFTPYRQASPLLVEMEPKAIIEDFQVDFGRMNALLGVEIKHTNITNQTSIPQTYADPPTELVKLTTDPFTVPLGSASDGTQIWKITHNGVDTHAMHFHMFHVQLVNRVGWDGAVRPPDPNELGWKDTVRMNPLEDVVVALRPRTLSLPFKVPNSIRLMDPARPQGSPMGFTNVDPQGNPVTVTNDYVNFGWEYVWHCHLLGHEENDMMHALVVANPPEAPSGLSAAIASGGRSIALSWTDNSVTANGFRIERATDNTFANPTAVTPPAYAVTYTDPGPFVANQTYFYRVIALNTVGSSVPGYPTTTAESVPSNIATFLVVSPISASPTSLSFTSTVNVRTAAQTVTVRNTSTTAVAGLGIALGGAGASQFAQSNSCGKSLAAGASCTVNVTFRPTTSGAKGAELVLTFPALGSPLSVPLSGTVLAPVLAVSPGALAFGSQAVGTTSAARPVTVSNAGTAPLGINAISLGGTSPRQFAISANTCGASLAPGASCTVSVAFAPRSPGAKSAPLNVTVAAPATSSSVALSGTGQ